MNSGDLRNRLDKIIPETVENDEGLAADVRVLLGMLEDHFDSGSHRMKYPQAFSLLSVCDELIGRWENESKAFVEYDAFVTNLAEGEAS